MSTLNTHTYKIGRILKAHICIKCLEEFGKCARLWHTERTPWMRSFHWNAHSKYLLKSTIRRGKKNERKWHIREKNSLAANICTHELKSRTMNVFVFIVVARTDSGICLIKSNIKSQFSCFSRHHHWNWRFSNAIFCPASTSISFVALHQFHVTKTHPLHSSHWQATSLEPFRLNQTGR